MKYTEKDICSFFEKKLSLFQQYVSVTKKIKDAFMDEGKGNPGVFIAERQGLINGIQKIDSVIEKLMDENRPQSGGEGYREAIETRRQDIKALMETAKPIDDELIAFVGQEKEEAKRALLKLRNARQAASGYQRMGKSIPRFFDKLR